MRSKNQPLIKDHSEIPDFLLQGNDVTIGSDWFFYTSFDLLAVLLQTSPRLAPSSFPSSSAKRDQMQCLPCARSPLALLWQQPPLSRRRRQWYWLFPALRISAPKAPQYQPQNGPLRQVRGSFGLQILFNQVELDPLVTEIARYDPA